jgi:hypothetical protein
MFAIIFVALLVCLFSIAYRLDQDDQRRGQQRYLKYKAKKKVEKADS